MKLKYNFIVRNVAGQAVALAVGNENDKFNGMIKLNSVGEFIFKLLENDISTEEIINKITENYDVSAEEAKNSIEAYLETLRENNLIIE
ncbi:MAG: PqqD family protein [Clostridia bacterium]|nr:PqqD family protein [Clostridia bacterium]